MTCVCLIPLRPSLLKCVLNSNVCGFLPMVFMTKKQNKDIDKTMLLLVWCLEMGGVGLAGHYHVKTLMFIVERWEDRKSVV